MTIKNITARNLYSTLIEIQRTNDKIQRFIGTLEVWKEIKNHIEQAPCFKCDLIRKDFPLYYQKGSEAFSIPTLYASPVANSLRICFNVYFDLENIEADDPRYSNGNNRLDVPLDLVTDFTSKAFNCWRKKQRLYVDRDYKGDMEYWLDRYVSMKHVCNARAPKIAKIKGPI